MDFSFAVIKEVFFGNFYGYLDYYFNELKRPAWDNPFYIIVFVYIVTFSLEIILPKKINYPLLGRKWFKLDLVYLFFIDFVFMGIGFFAITGLVEFLLLGLLEQIGIKTPLVNIDVLPVFIQFILFFIIADFVQFLAHYLLHRVNFLWEFHKIHHAQEQLGFASTRHFHWAEFLILKPMMYIPLGLLGYSAKYYVVFYIWIVYFFVFLSHCNIKLNWGFWNYIIINPDTHFWHHSKNAPGKFGVNFASVLNIWDILFRTFYLPKDKTPQLGVHDMKEIPSTFIGQTMHPFIKVFKKNRISPPVHQGIINTSNNNKANNSDSKKKSGKKK